MRKSKLRAATAVLAAGMAITTPLRAIADGYPTSLSQSKLNAFAPISNQELNDSRGGFDIGGVSFNFGASVQTLVNGQLALQTNVQWTAAGAVVTQLQGLGAQIQNQVQNQVAAALTAAGIGSTGTGSGSSGTGSTNASVVPTVTQPVTPTVTVPTSPANVVSTVNAVIATVPALSSTPSSSTAPTPTSVLPNVSSGVQIQSPTGTTDVLANVANGQIQNIVLNTASNQSIVQNTNIVLTINNFTAWQQQLAQHAVSMQIVNQMLSPFGH